MKIVDKNAKAYDDQAQAWTESIRNNIGHKYLEKPAINSLVPDSLEDKVVLCVGVGEGYELTELLSRKPSKVFGIDISQELVKIAQSKYPETELSVMDMNQLSFEDGKFDLVYSSLAFHYSNDWDTLLGGMFRVLKVGGSLVFSTHHPDYWNKKPRTGEVYKNDRGVELTEHTAVLPGDVSIIYYNHPDVDSILSSLEYVGFKVEKCLVPEVVDIKEGEEPDIDRYTKFKQKNKETPLFLVITATK